MEDQPSLSPPDRVGEALRFFAAFLRSPRAVGAVLPSSGYLARAMLAGHDLARARLVVELGPGTGAFTRFLERAIGPSTILLAIEVDAQAVAMLRRRHPRVQVRHDSAERVREHLEALGHRQADAVVSGIPWASMGADSQRRIMMAVRSVLAPAGAFSTFTYLHSPYLPAGARYARLLRDLFPSVRRSRIVWRNVPPALVYRCNGAV